MVPVSSLGLRLYKLEAMTDVDRIAEDGYLRLGSKNQPPADQWKIGLRENLHDAVDREIKIVGDVTKESHAVLEITFTPLGVAHYTQTCQGGDYKFQPTLVKQTYRDGKDWKV